MVSLIFRWSFSSIKNYKRVRCHSATIYMREANGEPFMGMGVVPVLARKSFNNVNYCFEMLIYVLIH